MDETDHSRHRRVIHVRASSEKTEKTETESYAHCEQLDIFEYKTFKLTRWNRARYEAEADIEMRLNPEDLMKYMMRTAKHWKRAKNLYST